MEFLEWNFSSTYAYRRSFSTSIPFRCFLSFFLSPFSHFLSRNNRRQQSSLSLSFVFYFETLRQTVTVRSRMICAQFLKSNYFLSPFCKFKLLSDMLRFQSQIARSAEMFLPNIFQTFWLNFSLSGIYCTHPVCIHPLVLLSCFFHFSFRSFRSSGFFK